MKAQELRIGNYVHYKLSDSEFVRVEGIQRDYPSDIVYIDEITWDYLAIDDIEPLAITEELLIDFGFFKKSEWAFSKEGFTIYRDSNTKNFKIVKGDFYKELKYVHQLQNLFFDLTGEELTV